MLSRALVGIEKQFGPDHVRTLEVVAHVASMLLDCGDSVEACNLNQRVLTGYEVRWCHLICLLKEIVSR